MKRVLFGLIILSLTSCAGLPTKKPLAENNTGNVTNYETDGNLAVTKTETCTEIRQLSSNHTPADIYTGISDCLTRKDIDRAAKLYALAFVYGRYDQYRVADRTAHQATKVLELQHLGSVDQELSSEFSKRIGEISANPEELGRLCVDIKALGQPSYHPSYMIQHGIKAFAGGGKGLNPDFSGDTTWQKVLDEGIHCPA